MNAHSLGSVSPYTRGLSGQSVLNANLCSAPRPFCAPEVLMACIPTLLTVFFCLPLLLPRKGQRSRDFPLFIAIALFLRVPCICVCLLGLPWQNATRWMTWTTEMHFLLEKGGWEFTVKVLAGLVFPEAFLDLIGGHLFPVSLHGLSSLRFCVQISSSSSMDSSRIGLRLTLMTSF